MKIVRIVGGVKMEFILSDNELYNAYEEQQHLFDLEDVKGYFDGYSEEDCKREYGLSSSEVEDRLDEIAYEMRRNIDKYDMDWYYAREAAISELL